MMRFLTSLPVFTFAHAEIKFISVLALFAFCLYFIQGHLPTKNTLVKSRPFVRRVGIDLGGSTLEI